VKARRITEISVQTDEAFIIHRRAGSTQASCAQCGPSAPMVTPEEGAILFEIPVRAIYREIEGGQLHFQETPAGSVVVCLDSLQKIVPLLSSNSNSQTQNNKEISS
jgi:hypothetical protein